MELKSWIKAARKHAKLTGEQLGEKLGRSKANISGWEKGLHEPSWSQIKAISEITRYPLVNLALDFQEMPPEPMPMRPDAWMLAMEFEKVPDELPDGQSRKAYWQELVAAVRMRERIGHTSIASPTTHPAATAAPAPSPKKQRETARVKS